jgi:hypothetical protein
MSEFLNELMDHVEISMSGKRYPIMPKLDWASVTAEMEVTKMPSLYVTEYRVRVSLGMTTCLTDEALVDGKDIKATVAKGFREHMKERIYGKLPFKLRLLEEAIEDEDRWTASAILDEIIEEMGC